MVVWATTHPWKECLNLELDSAHHIPDVLSGNKFILIEVIYCSKHKHSVKEDVAQ